MQHPPEEEKQVSPAKKKEKVGPKNGDMIKGKKYFEFDFGKDNDKRVVLVLSIETPTQIIQATIREMANLDLVSDKIAFVAEFKTEFPKKFKEVFQVYLRNEYNRVLSLSKV